MVKEEQLYQKSTHNIISWSGGPLCFYYIERYGQLCPLFEGKQMRSFFAIDGDTTKIVFG